MTLSKSTQLNDLSFLDIRAFANEGLEVEVLHPVTGAPLESENGKWVVTLAGKDSDEYRRLNSEAVQRRYSDSLERNKITPELLEEERFFVLAGCIICWRNFIKDGEEFPYSPQNARYMVTQYPWFSEQIEKVILSREQYFLANTKPLSNT